VGACGSAWSLCCRLRPRHSSSRTRQLRWACNAGRRIPASAPPLTPCSNARRSRHRTRCSRRRPHLCRRDHATGTRRSDAAEHPDGRALLHLDEPMTARAAGDCNWSMQVVMSEAVAPPPASIRAWSSTWAAGQPWQWHTTPWSSTRGGDPADIDLDANTYTVSHNGVVITRCPERVRRQRHRRRRLFSNGSSRNMTTSILTTRPSRSSCRASTSSKRAFSQLRLRPPSRGGAVCMPRPAFAGEIAYGAACGRPTLMAAAAGEAICP
jgi:hypothetical protein